MGEPRETVLASWIHVSDLHFGHGHGDAGHQWNQRRVLEELIVDVQGLARESVVPRPDFIFVTGDIAFSGGSRTPPTGTTEYALASEWIRQLQQILGIPSERVFVVPGNHDVDRKADADVRRLLRGARAGDESINEILQDPRDLGLLRGRMARYLAFAQDFGPPASDRFHGGLWWRQRVDLAEGVSLRICGLNTALLSVDDHDQGKLRVSQHQLAQLFVPTPGELELALVLGHHPVTGHWLADEKDTRGQLDRHAAIHLFGHLHEADSEQAHHGWGTGCLRIAAGAAHAEAASVDSPPVGHGYNFGALVVLPSGDLVVRIWPRRWSTRAPRFVADVENTNDGRDHAEHRLPEKYRIHRQPKNPKDAKLEIEPGDLFTHPESGRWGEIKKILSETVEVAVYSGANLPDSDAGRQARALGVTRAPDFQEADILKLDSILVHRPPLGAKFGFETSKGFRPLEVKRHLANGFLKADVVDFGEVLTHASTLLDVDSRLPANPSDWPSLAPPSPPAAAMESDPPGEAEVVRGGNKGPRNPRPNTGDSDPVIMFVVREYPNPDADPESDVQFPQILLEHKTWDDFNYTITYHATLFTTPDTGYDLGNVKIFQPNGDDNTLPERFTCLDATFCSLGSASWYQRLLEHIEFAVEILTRLRDVTMLEPDKTLEIIGTRVFRRSVMREGTVERTWYELKQAVNPLRAAIGLPALQTAIADSEVPPTLRPDLLSLVDQHRSVEEGPSLPDAPEESESLTQGAAHTDPPEPSLASPPAEVTASAASPKAGQPTAGSTDAPSAPEPAPDPPAESPPPESQRTHESYTLSIATTGARLFADVNIEEKGKPLWSSADGVDWSLRHFLDHQGKPCTLQTALGLLPIKWDRGTTRKFGEKLAALVFGDRPDRAVVAAWTVQPGESRRIVLKLDEANLGVPWEYLVIDGGFIAERNISIVRHVESSVDAQPTRLGKPSHVLYVYANPGTENASLYDPIPHHTRLYQELSEKGILCHTLGNVNPEALKHMLERPHGDVFHFVGHGKPGGKSTDAALYLHRDDGQPGDHPVDAETIAQWIRYHPRHLVVLGACHGAAVTDARPNGSIGWRIVHETGTPVVAMQMAVPQEFSDAFTLDFYRRLHDVGYDIEAAVFLARRIEHSKRHAFGIPVLLADARALLPLPTLARAAEPPEWANFRELVIRVVWAPAEQAAQTWRETELAKPELKNPYADAIETDAAISGDSTLYRCAPEDPAELEDALAAVRRDIHDKSILKDLPRPPSPPPPPPAVVTHRRIDVEGDLPLHMRVADRLTQALDDIKKQLSIGPELVPRILGELLAGRHVLLTGPVGTGKTSLAQAIARALGYTAQIETASADWTRFEILGGFWPSPTAGQLGFTFRPGVFYEAVRANWSAVSEDEDAVKWRHVRRPDGTGGVWLILDELNRADMDRALGGVFTALETRKLRVPSATADGGSVEIPLPQDFRVIATINTADRHFLFRLSDALKRRFAFVDVPVASDWAREWEVLTDGTEPPPEDRTYADLRRFVGLVRVLHALGSALFLAALRFLQMSAPLSAGDDTYVWRLTQAITGSILPNLEDLRDAALTVLQTWATAADPATLARALVAVLPERDPRLADLLRQLASIPAAHESTDVPGDLQSITREARAAWIASRVTRAAEAAPLTALVATFRDLRRDDADA